MQSEETLATLPENLSPIHAEKLRHLSPGTYCLHRSWGFGRVRDWNPIDSSLTIDFQAKRGHVMQLGYGADSLSPLPNDHLLVQKVESLTKLQARAETDPVSVVQDAIRSLGNHATADGIQALLSPEVISVSAYKKWWDSTKRALKKNGLFYVPSRKTEALRQLEAPSALGESALENLRLANGPKAILLALAAVVKYWPEIKSEAVVAEIAELTNTTLAKIPKSQLPLQVELALARDDFFLLADATRESGPLAATALVPLSNPALSNLVDALPGSKQPKLLEALHAGLPEEWSAVFLSLLPRANGRVAEMVTEAFQEAGREAEVQAAVNRIIRERNITCDFLFWLCKNRPAIYASLIEPQLFMAILSVLEKDQFSEIKKGTKLYELVLGDKPLTAAILQDAPLADVRDITRAILLSPVFEELDKRSLLAAIIKLYPDVQAMVVGGDKSAAPEAGLIVSWVSLQRRKGELEDLVLKQIPQNSKDIGIARGYGDLRENHEFKSAKEMQTILMRRKAELETMVVRAQGTDFSHPETSKVSLGTEVSLRVLGQAEPIRYTILGAWDSDPARGIISYQTAVAQALLNRAVGESVALQSGEGQLINATIESITPHQIDLSVTA